MPATMDAFIQAVDEARRRLIRVEGNDISVRELIRRAGFDESQRPGVAYHLNRHKHTGERVHRVPVEVIRKLAKALPVTEEELTRAAAVASGLNVADRDILSSEVTYVVARFFGDETVTDAERQAATARILQIITEQTAKHTVSETGDDSPNVGT